MAAEETSLDDDESRDWQALHRKTDHTLCSSTSVGSSSSCHRAHIDRCATEHGVAVDWQLLGRKTGFGFVDLNSSAEQHAGSI